MRRTEYLARKGYEAEGDRRDDGKATRFLRLAAGGVAGVGWHSARCRSTS
ncbi:MAG: hypothetical protein ACLVK4_12495 [Alistipes shahii]